MVMACFHILWNDLNVSLADHLMPNVGLHSIEGTRGVDKNYEIIGFKF